MGFLKGKKILITGISSNRSIAFGIAKIMHQQNAELAFVCQNKKISDKIRFLAKKMKSNIILSCDVSNDKNIYNLFMELKKTWKTFDGLVHSIAYCPQDQMYKNDIKNITKDSFRITHEISSYSFLSMVKECRNMLNPNSSLITLSYIGSTRVIPNYYLMGLAKASLETNVRYMASILGKDNIRVNAISASPIKTISSYKIKKFREMQFNSIKSSFIKKSITIEEIGNVAAFLSSNLSQGITGSIIYVDNGFHANGMTNLL